MLIRFCIGLLGCCFFFSAASAAEDIPVLHKGINLSNWLANAQRQPLYDWDFQQIEKAGFDNVRLPVKPELLAGDITAVDEAVNLAIAHGLNVVLDMHPAAPFMKALETDSQAQNDFIRLWMRVADHYRNYPSSELVFELLNEPQYYGHEEDWNAFAARLVTAIRQVDSSRFLIVGSPRGSSIEGLERMEPVPDAHIIYAFHFYEPYMITHQGIRRGFEKKMLRYFHDMPYPAQRVDHNADYYAETASNPEQAQAELQEYVDAGWDKRHIMKRLERVQQWSAANHVNVICGEFGVLRNHIDSTSRYRWIRDVRRALEHDGIGWQLWDYTDLDGITRLVGKTSTNPIDGSVRLVEPEKGNRIIEDMAVKALGLSL
jgi:hypothetical protein